MKVVGGGGGGGGGGFLSHAVHKMERETGRSHHVHDDVLCMVLCVVCYCPCKLASH